MRKNLQSSTKISYGEFFYLERFDPINIIGKTTEDIFLLVVDFFQLNNIY